MTQKNRGECKMGQRKKKNDRWVSLHYINMSMLLPDRYGDLANTCYRRKMEHPEDL